jgi:glutaredoxin
MKPLLTVLVICALGYVVDHWRELALRYHGIVPAAVVSSAESPALVIYGSKSCGPCVQLEHELDKRHITYQKKDLGNDAIRTELQDKLLRIGKNGGSIAIPVVEIDGALYEGATIDEVTKRLH